MKNYLLMLTTILYLLPVYGIEIDWFTDLRGENTGHTIFHSLNLPHSAILMATGQASSGGASDATDIPIFVANTGTADRNMFSATHVEWFMGLRKEYLGGLFPLLDIGTIGIYSQLFTPGDIKHARTIDEKPSSPSMLEYSLGASFARSFLQNRLSIGCAISYLESNLDHEKARGISGSFDLKASPADILRAHFYCSNFGPSISYGMTKESLPTQTGLSLQISPLPKAAIDRSHLNLTTGIGVRKIADQPIISGIQADIDLWDLFSLRTGYEYKYGTDITAEGLGVGASIKIGRYGIDGAWRYESKDLGNVWAATLKMQFEEIIPKSAEQYYSIAVKHYKKNRNNLSEYYARKALSLDPNLWKAHALINQLHSEELRQSNLEIGLIYTGNLRGVFLEPAESGNLGGLARQTTIFKKLKKQFKTALCIETGNLLSKSSDSIRSRIAGLFFDVVDFDIIAGGNEEIDIGLQKLKSQMKSKIFNRFLCTNHIPGFFVIEHQIIEKNGYKFFIASIVNETLVDSSSNVNMHPLSETDLLPVYAKKSDIRILILHDKWNSIINNPGLFSGFDIVLCGSIDQPFKAPMKINSSLLLSSGVHGEYVGNLILRFNKEKKLLSADNKLIPVSDQIEADSALSQIIKTISVKIPDSTTNDSTCEINLSKGDSRETFPFISNRNGSDQVFLKSIQNNAEFPITSKSLTASNPAISFSSSKIACRIQTDTGSRIQIHNMNGKIEKEIDKEQSINCISVTPDGKWVYFCGVESGKRKADIYRQNFSGGPCQSIIQTDSADEKDISFSPQEDLMAYSANKDGTYQIFLSSTAGTDPLKITNVKADHVKPTFSPDGGKLAYLSDRSNFGGKLDIWIYDRKKKAHQQITSYSNVKEFCWLSDSRTILYSSGTVGFEIYRVETERFRFSKLAPCNTVKPYNERSPMIVYLANKEKVVFTKEFQDGLKKIYLINLDGSDMQCIVNSKGNDWLPDYRK